MLVEACLTVPKNFVGLKILSSSITKPKKIKFSRVDLIYISPKSLKFSYWLSKKSLGFRV